MEVIKIIRETDVGESFPAPSGYEERMAARAVVFDADGNVTLLHVTKKGYHKLPGGGVEAGEDLEDALVRELREEIGCSVENLRELGIIEEYRNKFGQHQISHCFLADLSGEKGAPDFDLGEVADGFEPIWMSLEDATKTLEDEAASVDEYGGKFMCLRDSTFLKEVLRNCSS